MDGARLLVSPSQIQKNQNRSLPVPAPIRGIIADHIFGSDQRGGLDSAILMYNLIPGEYGARVRPGSAEFATTIPDAATEIRTIMHYNSTSGSSTKIFACTDQGIYDITAGGSGPHTKVVTWGSTGSTAGWCSFINYKNTAGDFLLVCDEDNGYVYYDGTSWTTAPTISGTPSPAAGDLVHVTEWQGRVWFVERDTGDAWFFDPLAISGNITKIPSGDRFRVGGTLRQNATWTLDAGDGVNDKLVQISSEGDVLVWEGINPTSSSDMTLIGRWVVGAVPAGRRVLSSWGGDVLIITTSGIIKVSTLLSPNSNLSDEQYVTKNIARYFREEMTLTSSRYGWSIELVPNEGIAVVLIPQPASTSRSPIQFVVNTITGAWSIFRGLEMYSMVKTASGFQFGDSTGKVFDLEGALDNVDLAASSSSPIVYSFVSHYSDLGMPGVWKRPQFIRTHWVGAASPVYSVRAKFDFDVTEITTSPSADEATSSLWDTGLWDTALWQSELNSYADVRGLSGQGSHVGLAIRGESVDALTYVGSDMIVGSGGFL